MTIKRTLTHWGAFDLEVEGGQVRSVTGRSEDPDPSPIIDPIRNSGRNRVRSPAVRSSWLEHGIFSNPERRGVDPLIDVDWDTALDLAATALDQVRNERGNAAIFGGSYGWGSAGRFHHAQSQLKRFLNTIGGFTGSHGTYSHGAAEVVVPKVTNLGLGEFHRQSAPHPDVVATTIKSFVSLGGFPGHNARITSGGASEHWYRPTLCNAAARGCEFIAVSPTYGDFDEALGATWFPIRPGTDAALLIALAGHLVAQFPTADGAAPPDDRYRNYLLGYSDGIVKNAEWASSICGLDTDQVHQLEERVTDSATMLNATWSTQRVEYGEQTIWALLALGVLRKTNISEAAVTTFGYGSMGSVGAPWVADRPASLPQGDNPVVDHIPVARIADALLNPGGSYTFDGVERTYPKLDAIYWCGGNPFHHHQDLHRLDEAWKRPRVVLINEPAWTATARRSDIVFPSTFGFERSDIGGASTDKHLMMMEAAVESPSLSRNDYEIFTALAKRLGTEQAFTAGRSSAEWIEELYERTRERVPELPEFADFVERGVVERPAVSSGDSLRVTTQFESHETPVGATPHPRWIEPVEWLGAADPGQFHLVTPMPAVRLHSQHGGEPDELPVARLNSEGLRRVGAEDGQTIRVWNDRGALRAQARADEGVAPHVISIDNGYPFKPLPAPNLECAGGNVNCLTSDRGTSGWAQATAAHSCLVRVSSLGSVDEKSLSGRLVSDQAIDDSTE